MSSQGVSQEEDSLLFLSDIQKCLRPPHKSINASDPLHLLLETMIGTLSEIEIHQEGQIESFPVGTWIQSRKWARGAGTRTMKGLVAEGPLLATMTMVGHNLPNIDILYLL